MKIKHTFLIPKICLILFFTLFALLTLLLGHRVYLLKFQGSTALPKSHYQIESNFVNFDVSTYPVMSRSSKLLIESKTIDSNNVIVIVSDRVNGELQEFLYVKNKNRSKLDYKATLNLAAINEIVSYDKSKFYVFDLLIEKDLLYASIVEIPQNKSDCDIFKIISLNLSSFNLKSEGAKLVWRSSSCTKSYPNNPGWNDFHGRLASSKNYVYLTAGLLIASTYQGTYPNPSIYNIGPDLFKEIDRNKLFGSVIQINKISGLSREFASGFRGPSGIVVQDINGVEIIWGLDHGPRGGDELNLIEFNRNYGWPYVTFGMEYFEPIVQDSISAVIKTKFGTHLGYEMPKYVWTPSVAPSALTVLNENLDLLNTWSKNDLLIGTLKDNSLIHVKLAADRVILVEKVYLGARIRDITSNNRVVFISTDDGRVLTLTPGSIITPSGPFPDIYPKENYLYSNIPGIRPFVSWVDKMLQDLARLI